MVRPRRPVGGHPPRVRAGHRAGARARGAEYARALQGRFYHLSAKALFQLTHAIRHHSGGDISTDATIQTCWDADRLDLGRVGITPSAEFLSGVGASRIEVAYPAGVSGGRSG